MIGVRSHAVGAVHYDLKFLVASPSGDYCTVVYGKTSDKLAIKESVGTEVKNVNFIEKDAEILVHY